MTLIQSAANSSEFGQKAEDWNLHNFIEFFLKICPKVFLFHEFVAKI